MTAALGRPRVHHRRTDSTNERARVLAQAGAPHGTLVTADAQTAGRGRQGRRWEAPPGRALLASLVLRDLGSAGSLLPFAVAIAVCEACERSLAGVTPRCAVKWPNDVWVDRRKLAGILIEGRPQDGWAIAGVGVNVLTARAEFAPELRDHATSLALEAEPSAAPPTAADVLDALLAELSGRLADPPETLLDAWRARDALHGEDVRWQGGEGVAAGVDDRGALIVESPAGRRVLDAGEVHLERPPPDGRSGFQEL